MNSIQRYEQSIERLRNKRGNKKIPVKFSWPLTPPLEFKSDDELIYRLAFCLSLIKQGTAIEITQQLMKIQPELDFNILYEQVKPELNRFYRMGFIDGQFQWLSQCNKYWLVAKPAI